MKELLEKISGYSQRVKQYYVDAEAEIASTNLMALKYCCFAGMVFGVFFCLLAPLIISGWSITPEYYASFFVFVVFYFFYLALNSSETFYPKRIQFICALFCCACLVALIGISVFPYPDTPQFYLTAFYIFLPVVFIHRPRTPIIVMGLCEIAFLILASIYKTPKCLEQDIFNSIASIAFSIIVMLLVNRLRVSDYNARAELRELGCRDGLTGLLNKTSFENLVNDVLPEDRPDVEGCALLVIDLDSFKDINDTYGHKVGDDLLINVGLALKRIFRSTDLISRFGGDEFCVLMQGISQQGIVEQKLHSLFSSLESLQLSAEQKSISCSVGVAFPIIGAVSYEDAFRAADANMYAAKVSGKHDYRISAVSKGESSLSAGKGTA